MFSGFYTTNKGHNYIAKSMEGKTLVLTRGQYGDGALPEGAVITAMTALISPLADMHISKQNTIENCIITTTQFTNRVNGSILPPFHLMEAGIFGKIKNADGTDDENNPEVLLFYANEQTKEKADYIPGILTEFLINWPLTISGAENITVEISDSLIYPTMEDFNERVAIKVTAGGTGDSLTIGTEDNEPLKDGVQASITLTENLGADAKISYNGGEEYPILNANGTPVTEGQQVAGSVLNVVFNEESKCWYIIGGGSVEIATDEEALKAEDDTKMMTPLKVAVYVGKVIGDIDAILDEINGKESEEMAEINAKLDIINGKVV